MRISRRKLPAVLLAPAVGRVSASAPAPAKPENELQSAREQVRRNGETLAKFEVPVTTEPAFQFKV